jgi:hypothetical protein
MGASSARRLSVCTEGSVGSVEGALRAGAPCPDRAKEVAGRVDSPRTINHSVSAYPRAGPAAHAGL